MRKLFLAGLLCLWPVLASAQNTIVNATISTAGADCSTATRCADWDMRGVVSATIYLNVGTSGTFVFEASTDATSASTGTWFAVNDDVNAAANATVDGAYSFSNPGYRRMRFRASAISGAATVVGFPGLAALRSTASVSVGAVTINDSGADDVSDDATNSINVRIAADAVGIGGGTQYAFGTAAGATDTGTVPLVIRDDALTTLADPDGDYVGLRVSSIGSLWTALSSAIPTGTNSIGQVTANAGTNLNTSALLTTTAHDAAFGTAGSADAQVRTIQGVASMTPVLVDPGTAANFGVQAEDGIHSSGENGVLALVVRQDAASDLAADGDRIPMTVDADGGLRVSIVAGAGSGGTALADDADFIAGTTSFTPVGGFYQSTVTACTDGDVCTAGITAQRTVKMTPFTSAGVELSPATFGTTTYTETTTTGSAVGGVRNDALAALAGTDNEIAPFQFDALGALWSRFLDPCSGVAKTFFVVDIVTATTVEIANAVASEFFYICSIDLHTNAANNVVIAEDDTDGCGSISAGVTGGTTAGEGYNFGANGGRTLGNGLGTVAKTTTANRYLCILTSAATQLSGSISYVSAP